MFRKFTDIKQTPKHKSRTASLWFEYSNIIDIIKKLITADRIGDWNLHLIGIKEALPVFAAAGHSNYVKSAYLYLQNMTNLKSTNEKVYNNFKNGHFIVRRSNRYWAGLPCDLIIEQVLMRSLKTTGGLTRGSGMSDITRAVWFLSNPISSRYSLTIEETIKVMYTGSEQHKTATKARANRDRSDTIKLFTKLAANSPLKDDPRLYNIINGITAPQTTNVDEFYNIGKTIIKKMEGLPIFTYEFERKNQAMNMTTKITLSKKDDIHCDPVLLFQRLLVVSQTNPVNMDDIMSYELSAFPLSLFDSPVTLRKANKPKITEEIKKHVNGKLEESDIDQVPPQYFVLDGGSLLHKIKWNKDKTYGEIAHDYGQYVLRKYSNVTVVFDGYSNEPTTKDMTHLRRTKLNSQRDVIFDKNTKFV